MKVMLRYTLKVIVDVEADYPDAISELLDNIRSHGIAELECVEVFDKQEG